MQRAHNGPLLCEIIIEELCSLQGLIEEGFGEAVRLSVSACFFRSDQTATYQLLGNRSTLTERFSGLHSTVLALGDLLSQLASRILFRDLQFSGRKKSTRSRHMHHTRGRGYLRQRLGRETPCFWDFGGCKRTLFSRDQYVLFNRHGGMRGLVGIALSECEYEGVKFEQSSPTQVYEMTSVPLLPLSRPPP